ncbi:hypothetical protein [Listeria sp. ILCC797]|uniref:hypothetical protein n=1 Tax=Listeria sp. ILCC797 TaxID=1918333 RepID=UPI000B58ED66|nr:hypothetical protein [Listeria sp. ILCC797]
MMKRKGVFFLILIVVIWLGNSTIVLAEGTLQNPTITDDPVELLQDYGDFSFPLMTKEYESLNKLAEVLANMGVTIKNAVMSVVIAVGKFNANVIGFLFDYDAMKPIRQPILDMTNVMAGSLLGIATTIGATVMGMMMVVKFILEQNIKRALMVFLMAVVVVTAFTAMKSPTTSKQIMNFATNLDTAVASKFTEYTPVIEGDQHATDAAGKKVTPGTRIKANIFKANVIVPYWIANYGSSNADKINEKTISYNNQDYNRIGLLMGNADSSQVDDNFVSDLAKIEYDDLGNKNVGWKKSLSVTNLLLFFLILNLFQMVIFFLLFVVKSMLGFLLTFLFPLSLLILLFSMFSSNMNPIKNIGKGYLTLMLFKGGVSFMVYFYTSYMILAYRTSDSQPNSLLKIAIIMLYMLMPLAVYVWRHFLFSLLQTVFTGRPVQGQQLAKQFFNPAAAGYNRNGKEKPTKEEKERLKAKKEQERENARKRRKIYGPSFLRAPKRALKLAQEARKGLQEKQEQAKAKEQAGQARVQNSKARQVHRDRQKGLEETFQDVEVGHGRNGSITPQQMRRQAKRQQIEQKHERRREKQDALQRERAYEKQRAPMKKAHQQAARQQLDQKRSQAMEPKIRRPSTQRQLTPNPATNRSETAPTMANRRPRLQPKGSTNQAPKFPSGNMSRGTGQTSSVPLQARRLHGQKANNRPRVGQKQTTSMLGISNKRRRH